MNKRIVRIQLLVLGVLAILVVSRVFKGLPSPEGEVTIHDIGTSDLEHRAFSTDAPVVLQVAASGSLEREISNPTPADMAAHAWITRRSDRSLVWQIDPAHDQSRRGTLVHVDDTVPLEPGTYDLYFASFGVHEPARSSRGIFGFGDDWTSDKKHWQVAVKLAEGQNGRLRMVDDDVTATLPRDGQAMIWTTGPMGGHGTSEQFFTVAETMPLSIYAIGELCSDSPCDTGWIENVRTGERVWRLETDNSEPAGGWKNNRKFSGLVELKPGTYRMVYKTDAGHAFGDWLGNPPFDPAGWGLTVGAAEQAVEQVKLLSLWNDRTPFVNMTRVSDGEHRTITFDVGRVTPVVTYVVGELYSSGSKFDYGWIEDARGNRVWEMSWGASSHAGGDRKNRIEESLVVLEPGRYVANYVTDDSHSYDDWNARRPSNPERWGLSLFLLDEEDRGSVTVGEPAAPMNATVVPVTPPNAAVLVDLTRVSNDADLSAGFELTENTEIHIHSVGEITSSERFDYGWIEDGNGEIVWSMTRANSVAGGGDRYRIYDGRLTLPAGDYVAYYTSDGSYAFGDFGESTPGRPQDYGIRVTRGRVHE